MGLFVWLCLTAAPPPELALLSTVGDAEVVELRFQKPGAPLNEPAVSFRHIAGSSVWPTVVQGRLVAAVTQVVEARDRSFSGGLFALEPNAPAKLLVDRVAIPSAPLALPNGHVLVTRGQPGDVGLDGRLDALTLDDVDPRTNQTRTLLEARAFMLHAVGVLDGEVLLYVTDRDGGRLEALSLERLTTRRLFASPEPAHDFTVDEKQHALFFTLADSKRHDWRIARLDVRTVELTDAARGPEVALLPTVFPSGSLGFAPAPGAGLIDTRTGKPLLNARGAGFERVRRFVNGWAVGNHEVPGHLPVPFAVELASGRALNVEHPTGARVEVAGVVTR